MHDDDFVIAALEKSMEELKKVKLDLPGPPTKDELPTRPFGSFVEPTFEQMVGIRAEKFSEREKAMNETVTLTSERAKETIVEEEERRERHLSVGDSAGLAGTDVDTVSGCGSELSLDSRSSICESTASSVYECTRL